MSHSHSSNRIHLIFSTKNHEETTTKPLTTPSIVMKTNSWNY
jgi:hypothetical protein